MPPAKPFPQQIQWPLQPAGAFLSFDQGLLQARIYQDTGHVELAGPDLAGAPAANIIRFAPPAVLTAERAILSVSQLTDQLRGIVDEKFPAVWVEGEISNFRLYSSGHAYFTLKDENAQLRAVLFRTRTRRLRFEPGDGQHVIAFGSLEVYAQRGEYQLVVELLEPRGLGALQLAFEQLKQRLGAEGLFDATRKRPLPRFPRKIGVVTSPSGAALRDILRIIGRRFAGLHIVIAPCRVAISAGDFDRIELAPFAQCSFRGFRFEIVPAIEGLSSRQQGS